MLSGAQVPSGMSFDGLAVMFCTLFIEHVILNSFFVVQRDLLTIVRGLGLDVESFSGTWSVAHGSVPRCFDGHAEFVRI